METLIAVAPLFDDVTVYSIAWMKEAIDEIEDKVEVIELLNARARRYLQGSYFMIVRQIPIYLGDKF